MLLGRVPYAVLRDSQIPLSKWLVATYLLCSSKKGISATSSTAPLRSPTRLYGSVFGWRWKIRQADSWALAAVEADIGRKPGMKKARWPPSQGHNEMVFSLVERNGKVRAIHITDKMFYGIKKVLKENVSPTGPARRRSSQWRAPECYLATGRDGSLNK